MVETKAKGMTNIKAIMTYFSQGTHGRKVTMLEMKELDTSDRQELGAMCCKELNVTQEA